MIISKSFLGEYARKNNITDFSLKHSQILGENMNLFAKKEKKEETFG